MEAFIFNEKEKAKVLVSLLKTLDTEEHNDVEIILEDGSLKASKLVLSCRSEFFQRMFDKSSQFAEQKQSSVKFPCKKLIMKKILQHLYGGELSVSGMTCSQVIELMNMLRYMLLQDAFEVLENFLKEDLKCRKISMKESIEAIEMAETFKLTTASGIIANNISENVDILISDYSEIIPTLPSNVVIQIVTHSFSNRLYQINHLKFVEKWFNTSKEKVRKWIKKVILGWFDLTRFSVEDLLGDVRNSKLFKEKYIFEAVNKVHKKVDDEKTKLKQRLKSKGISEYSLSSDSDTSF